jgi:hypothetical protein
MMEIEIKKCDRHKNKNGKIENPIRYKLPDN